MSIGVWRSLVSRLVRVQEARGSNPRTPTKSFMWKHEGFFYLSTSCFWNAFRRPSNWTHDEHPKKMYVEMSSFRRMPLHKTVQSHYIEYDFIVYGSSHYASFVWYHEIRQRNLWIEIMSCGWIAAAAWNRWSFCFQRFSSSITTLRASGRPVCRMHVLCYTLAHEDKVK